MKLKLTARIFSSALAAAMLFTVSALAADVPAPSATRANTEYQSSTVTNRVGGQSYGTYSSVYIDGNSAFASVWIRTSDDARVPSGSMGSQPKVFSSDGSVLATSTMAYSGDNAYHMFQNTPSVRFSGYVHGGGDYELYNGSGYNSYSAPNTANVQKRALMAQLDSNGEYPVNGQGQSYGSDTLASLAGHQPDLISAVGVGGVNGYILREDINPKMTTRREALMHTALANNNLTILLYDMTGSKIGTFALSPLSQETVDAAWAAVTEMDEVERIERFSAQLVNGEYPVNARGQSYGTGLLAGVVGHSPDLQSATNENGVAGYILTGDISPNVNTPEEAMEYMLRANDRLIIPLYDAEGNAIDTFKLGPISEEHLASARASLAQMRSE